MYRYKNFSESGNKAITAAISIAGKMGHITVGSEHLLMGILSCGKSDAADLLSDSGINFVCVYNIVVNVMGTGQATMVTAGDMSANAVEVLKKAWETAQNKGRGTAGVEEILYSMLCCNRCMACRILKTLTESVPGFASSAERLCRKDGRFHNGGGRPHSLKTLEKYGRNMINAARSMPFDPCIGRDGEIRQIIEILLRRQKNNPCLTGYAGVGKTALVEGLANMIATGQVPVRMKNKVIYALDMPMLLAGTKYRGDFEERIKSVIEEASSSRDIILFIDEIHIIVNAGGAEGAIDAANILKPALARGQIQVIGATTRREYARCIEKDSALERRFSPVNVCEPTVNQAVKILQGVKEKYQKHHGVEITDEAVKECVGLSDRYIHYRCLPDKAIDLMDSGCAAVKLQGRNRLTAEDIKQALEKVTGLANNRIVKDRSVCLELESKMTALVSGQDSAVGSISRALRLWRAGLRDSERPVASFLFAGPTGVGKTYSCYVLAEILYGDKKSVVRIDCTEYAEKNDVTKLTGSPPGYVGYDEGGRLEKEMGRNPSCVLLFDEIEKAHPDMYNLLLQAMDSGFITTSSGKKISFKNCIIIMTSNLGADSIAGKNVYMGFAGADGVKTAREQRLHTRIRNHFPPEFIGRLDGVIPFMPLSAVNIRAIARRQLQRLCSKLAGQGISLEYDERIIDFIAEKCAGSEYGARNIKSIISTYIETDLGDMIITGALHPGMNVELTVGKDKIELKTREEIMC